MGLPKYIINFDELTSDLKKKVLELIENELDNKYPQLDTNNIEALLENIKGLLPSEKYKGLKEKIEALINYRYEGKQKIRGILLDIPPIIKENISEFKFNKDIYITGLSINQTGWKKEDKYSLAINKNKIIDGATVKEIGEHKYFNTYYEVFANSPISFILQNNSGNSRQIMVDLEYIEGTKTTVVIEPPTTGLEDIPNDWDIAVVMHWEKNSTADIDLHGVLGDMHVYFGRKTYEGLYLNFDYLEHTTNKNPEILSVKGHKDKKLQIYVNNYNGKELLEPIEIKVYKKISYGNILLKTYNVNIDNDRLIGNGICEIDLNSVEIKDMFIKKDIRLL
ncbi:hypothetical protein [Clostridium sp. DJ247]|uniref:hypothetical protein n=1 Tax=Clostridium sp. DJ247 TaxID=2726188 RepID=UPI001628063D|nr:hypothetical protein [Clostridium sp. DJ247]MBC2580002.1 hypothetical protein [Clostridium sp. DJ247]